MDVARYRDDLRASAGRMRWWQEVDKWRGSGKQEDEEEELVEVLLRGKAPWGFTLRGGTEHREALVITKVEEGSAAAAVHLQAGDEMVSVNAVWLSGSRQEAICLVKSSYKTLTLWSAAKMVDVVSPPTMPSETDIHVARNFLTKILRSSMRRHDPGPQPPSRRSSQLTEEESGPRGPEAPPAPVWRPKHEARSEESLSPGDQKTRLSMDRPPHSYPAGRLSPPKSAGKRDSAFSCLSGSSGTPVHDSSAAGRTGPGEDRFLRVPQQNLQPPAANGGWDERVSASGRWQLPSQSPPPPAPPQRSDSFAATKVLPYCEGAMAASRSHGRSSEQKKLFSLSSSDVRLSAGAQPPAHLRALSDDGPAHLRALSDDGPAHLRARAPPTNTQSVGNYYRSLQDLPVNAFSRTQARRCTGERQHGLLGKQADGRPRASGGERQHGLLGKQADGRPRASGGETGSQGSLKTSVKARYPLPPSQVCFGDSGGCRLGNGVPSRSPEEPQKSLDPWEPQEDHRISPLKTPLLHSLSQDSWRPAASAGAAQDAAAAGGGKASRRGDRYATTLRKEVQQKRAQLQKSRSAATLSCDAEDEEASASSAACFSNTYKDHLKEAQARVLQATSFQRRDLEPPELLQTSNRVRGRRRFHPKRTHSFSEPEKMHQVGVDISEEHQKLSEAKPAFSRPGPGSHLSTDLHDRDLPSGEAPPPADPRRPSPGRKQVLLEQQRLGTFAEYQATWTKQKKSSEARAQGRFHSAENILDADPEESICVHERSRSSPSADFHSQKIPSAWRDPQPQKSGLTSSENVERRSPDHSRQSVPGLPDHRTEPDPAGPSQTTFPCGRRSVSPNSGSKQSTQTPPTRSVPPPRPHLGPETTSCSQEFLAGAHSDPAALQPVSGSGPDTQNHAGPAPAGSPGLSAMSEPDLSKEGADPEEKEAPASSGPPSCRTAALRVPGTDGADRARCPSPQFAPLRLTDKAPAASLRDHSRFRSGTESQPPQVMDVRSLVRKVPVRIVHAESSSEREGQSYLPQVSETRSVLQPAQVPFLGTAEHPASSMFSAYTRPEGSSAPAQESRSAGASEEDAKREELARDIMGKDKSLVDILDQSGRKTTMDLMEGLFPPEEKILEGKQQRRRASEGSRLSFSPRTSDRRESEDTSTSAAASLVPSSSYYSTSAPKAELLIKMKDMQEQLEEQDSEDELDVDLASKKQELIFSLARKLEVLREARRSLQEDVQDNEALGGQVETTVQRLCRPNQLDKFRMFVGDLDKVVSLLLSLSGRLARVENALDSLEDQAPPEEKRTLTEKRQLLMRQHEDAKELKENLDRRERLVSGIMEAHLDAASLDDYRHFVKMKSALIIEQRKLEDKVKLGEEQLKCLLDSLPLEQRPLL